MGDKHLMFCNGKITQMSDEQFGALQKEQEELVKMFTSEPTPEERLAALESAMIAMMGGGQNV